MMKTHTILLSVIEQVLCIVARCASVSDTVVIISACDETRQHVAPSVFDPSSKVIIDGQMSGQKSLDISPDTIQLHILASSYRYN